MLASSHASGNGLADLFQLRLVRSQDLEGDKRRKCSADATTARMSASTCASSFCRPSENRMQERASSRDKPIAVITHCLCMILEILSMTLEINLAPLR